MQGSAVKHRAQGPSVQPQPYPAFALLLQESGSESGSARHSPQRAKPSEQPDAQTAQWPNAYIHPPLYGECVFGSADR